MPSDRPVFSDESRDSGQRNPWATFCVTSLGVVMVFMNMTTVDVALPSIVRGLGATPAAGNWILLAYMLGITVLVLPLGKLADVLSRKHVYMMGLAVFTLASLTCGLTDSPSVMIAARVVQAIGAAAVVTNNVAILADAFARQRLPVALGLNATVAAIASVCGPLIGGALVAWFGWRATFLALVPIGTAALACGAFILRNKAGYREPFDWIGAILSGLAFGTLVYAIAEVGNLGSSDWRITGALVVFALASVSFVIWQRCAQHPLIDVSLLNRRSMVLAYYANFTVSAVQAASILLLSLYLQTSAGKDVLAAGIGVSPFAIGLMSSAYASGRLMGCVKGCHLASLGMALATAGVAGLAVTAACLVTGPMQMLSIGLIGIGVGLFTTPNTASILGQVPSHLFGVANGLRSLTQNCGFVIGTAVALAVLTAPLSTAARQAVFTGHGAELDVAVCQLLQSQYVAAFSMVVFFALTGFASCLLQKR